MQVMEAVNVMANDKLVGVYDYLGDECRGLYVEFMTHGEKKGVGWPVCQEKRVHLKVHIFLEKKKKKVENLVFDSFLLEVGVSSLSSCINERNPLSSW